MKHIIRYTIPLASLIGLLTSPFVLQAQKTVDRQVRVIKPYEPSVSDAFKISILPTITDTIRIVPDFQYLIFPNPMIGAFTVDPITPARMTTSVPKLFNSHLRMGFGSYISPFAELSINTLRNENHTAGIWLRHRSSHGSMKLENNLKTYPAYNDNEAIVYGTRFWEKTALTANMGIESNRFHYYGVNPNIGAEIIKDEIRQNFLNFQTGLQLASYDTDSLNLNYNTSINYRYFQDRNNTKENGVNVKAGLQKFLRNEIVGAEFSLDYYNNTAFSDSSNTVFSFNPWISKGTNDWRMNAGFIFTNDKLGDNSRTFFYPKANFEFNIIENHLVPYVGLDGNLQINNYSTTALNNFFILPGLFVENTNNKMNLYGGIKGRLGRNTSFNLSAGYSVFENMHFFVNDTTTVHRNQFFVVYDDVERINYFGELAIKAIPRLELLLKANIYQYSLNTEKKAWHMPNFDLTVSAIYNIRDKIIVRADMFAIGKRYAKVFDLTEMIELKNIVDFNLGIEYRYTEIISAFLKFNNMGAARYYKWNQYPTHRFNLVAGFTYSL